MLRGGFDVYTGLGHSTLDFLDRVSSATRFGRYTVHLMLVTPEGLNGLCFSCKPVQTVWIAVSARNRLRGLVFLWEGHLG